MGASVTVFQNGDVTALYTFGESWITGPAITAETAFQCGSITKMISNIGLMQLLRANGYSLETELSDIFGFTIRHPEYPDTPVTLRQLMTHTASLRDGADYTQALHGDARTLEDIFSSRTEWAFIKGQEPGTAYSYSNFGGGLIGCLIEKLSGQTVDDYMRQNVFEPLGINAAYHSDVLRDAVPMADMYDTTYRRLTNSLREPSGIPDAPDPLRHYNTTAGKLIISAQDLAKLLIMLCDGGIYQGIRILKESDAAQICTLQSYTGSVACETNSGLFLNMVQDSEVDGRLMYGHGGKAYGMLCAAYFDPTDRTGVVMLTNGCKNSSTYNGVGMLGRQILTICYKYVIDPDHEVQDPFLID